MSYEKNEDHREYPSTYKQFSDAKKWVQAYAQLNKDIMERMELFNATFSAEPKDHMGHPVQAIISETMDDLYYSDIKYMQSIMDNYDDGYESEVKFQYNTSRI